jgi:hypothetical protein
MMMLFIGTQFSNLYVGSCRDTYRQELDIDNHTNPTESNVQSRRSPVFINTCHDAQFAPHVGANVNAGLHPSHNVLPIARKNGAGEALVTLCIVFKTHVCHV